jgi:ABC-type transport system involved in multi-copper enzyme maturation permease subunit
MAIRAIMTNVIRDALRQKIVYVTVLFTFLLFSIEPMLPSFQVGLHVQLFNDIALGVSYLAIAILAVALSVNQLPSEIEKRTIYNVLSKPIRRIDFLIGKFLGIQVVLFTCALIMGIAITVFTYVFFGKIQPGLLQGIGMEFLEASLISAFAIFVSTFVSPTVNVFACILFYFAGHIKTGLLNAIAGDDKTLGVPASIITAIIPSLENFNVNEAIARGVVLKTSLIVELLLYAVIFDAALLLAASIALSKKEL